MTSGVTNGTTNSADHRLSLCLPVFAGVHFSSCSILSALWNFAHIAKPYMDKWVHEDQIDDKHCLYKWLKRHGPADPVLCTCSVMSHC